MRTVAIARRYIAHNGIVERLSKHVSHLVEGTAGLEPGYLCLVHSVVELNLLRRAIGVLQNTANWLQETRKCT